MLPLGISLWSHVPPGWLKKNPPEIRRSAAWGLVMLARGILRLRLILYRGKFISLGQTHAFFRTAHKVGRFALRVLR